MYLLQWGWGWQTEFNTQLFFVLFCFFLGLNLWHMEVPRLVVELELQLPVYTTATAVWDPSRI